jgi:hypothetical protein
LDDFWVLVQPASGFSLTSSAATLSVVPGSFVTSTISVAPLAGFTGNVQLSVVSTLPPGVVASFNPNSTSTNSVVTLTAGTSVPPGNYLVMVAGTSGSQTNATAIELSISNATTTTLAITPTSTGSPYVLGNSLTLTATVLSGSAPVVQGQVNFCDASSAYCTDSHLLGTAQLTTAGTATLKFHPAMGSHSYKAVFMGTPSGSPSFETSTSPTSSLVVSGSTNTAIAATGAPGNYTLTATVAGVGSATAPSGTVSFLDTSNNNAILGTASVEPGSGSMSFTSSSSSITGNGSYSVVTGDFNGDGILDLAVTNSLSNTVSILLGNGNGTFTATQNGPATGNGPLGIVAGDFNGDGIVDLAVANSLSNTVTILLGNGDGTFTAAADSPNTGNSPTYIAVGDFNGDGKLDLAAVNSTGIGSSMTILLGNGDGTFTAMPDSPANGYDLGPVVVGDFNRDGNLDLAVKDEYGGTLMILLGKGDGTFNFFWSIPIQVYTNDQNLVTGDFNGDGNLDLAVVNAGNDTVEIFLGNGDGTFTAAADSPNSGNSPTSIAVGDFNGDGNLDMAVTNAGGNPITILLGNGDGTFTTAPNTPPNFAASPIAVGDWNGDGISDLAMLNININSVMLLTTSLTETATASVSGIAVTGSGSHAVAAAYPGDSLYGVSTSGTTSLNGENPAVAPTFSVPAGTYTSAQTVALLDSTPGAAIYFTANGTTPTTSSTPYRSPITVSATETIEAVAIANGYSLSSVASTTYTINIPSNPEPEIGSMSPAYVSAGGTAFTLTVNGTGFISGSTVYWGTTALATTYVSGTQLTASVPASDVVNAGTTAITVQTPAPGGGPSNAFQFEIDTTSASSDAPSFTDASATVAAGSTATYAVTLPSSASSVSVQCLNLLTGATCSYSASTGAVVIATGATTPKGTYQVTTVFNETVAGQSAAYVLLPFLIIPLCGARKKLRRNALWTLAWLTILAGATAFTLTGCGGGGGSSSTPPPAPTPHVTSSGIVTLTIQ